MIFGGGIRNFKLESDGGRRSDEDLMERYSEIKQMEGKESSVVYNTSDLLNWDQKPTDHVLGEFQSTHTNPLYITKPKLVTFLLVVLKNNVLN